MNIKLFSWIPQPKPFITYDYILTSIHNVISMSCTKHLGSTVTFAGTNNRKHNFSILLTSFLFFIFLFFLFYFFSVFFYENTFFFYLIKCCFSLLTIDAFFFFFFLHVQVNKSGNDNKHKKEEYGENILDMKPIGLWLVSWLFNNKNTFLA